MEGILAPCGESMVAIAASNVLLRLSSVTENYAKLLAASLPTVRAFLAYPITVVTTSSINSHYRSLLSNKFSLPIAVVTNRS